MCLGRPARQDCVDVRGVILEREPSFADRAQQLDQGFGHVHAVLAGGAARAHEVATTTYARAADAMGLLPPAE